MEISIAGVDIAKSIFQVCGVGPRRQVLFNKRLSRKGLEGFLAQLPRCRVVMESCYMSHYWGRRCQALGHEVQLIPAQHVKPFVRGNKNDANDALAIVEASERPGLRSVPVKSVHQQEVLALHRIRERLKNQRIQLMNQTRGLLAEFGVVMAQGHASFRKAMAHLDQEENLTPRLKTALFRCAEEYRYMSGQLEAVEQELTAFVESTPACGLLLSMPGIGFINASALVASIDRGQAFQTPRQFAVWLGLTPKQNASGLRSTMGGISKRGDRYLRTQLIHAARSALRWCRRREDGFSRWANALVARRGVQKATVAVAHRMARIAWVLLQRNEPFRLDAMR